MKTIRYYAPLRGIVKKESEATELGSVKDVLRYVEKAYGKEASVCAKSALIVINDVSIGLSQGAKTPLRDGDVIGFLPVCGGG
ncbi:MAG: MoaD/ThiS family protein [Eubacteriales bacterium]|jgi:molybdopterin converting factor small subunit|nr:MoaD/ThiS family protein [Eubacteriales bacterium]